MEPCLGRSMGALVMCQESSEDYTRQRNRKNACRWRSDKSDVMCARAPSVLPSNTVEA